MTTYYVTSSANGGSDSNAGTSWATAFLTVSYASTMMAAGDTLAIDSGMTDSYGAATTITFPGTASNPNFIYSCPYNSTLNSSNITAGAIIETAGTFNLTIRGSFYAYGLTLWAGSPTSAVTLSMCTTGNSQTYDGCLLKSGLGITTSGQSYIRLINTSFWFNSVGGYFNSGSNLASWKNSVALAAGSNVPNILLGGTVGSVFLVEGVDFSAFTGTTKKICAIGISANGQLFMKDCKLPSTSTPILGVTPTYAGERFTASRTDTSGTDNQFALYDYSGTETNNNTVTRSGGAQDFNSNAFSKQIATTANSSRAVNPFEALPMAIVNKTTGSAITVSVYGVWDSPYGANTPPNNNDIWIEVEYPKDSGDPLGGYVSSVAGGSTTIAGNPLFADAAYSTDGSTWAGTSLFTHPSPFVMTATITPEIAGPITVRVYAAKASTTFYIDAAPVL